MSGEQRVARRVAWGIIMLLALTLAHQAFGPGAELFALRAREAILCHRFDLCGAAIAAEASRVCRDEPKDEYVPSSVPETMQVIEELRLVRHRIAELESQWWRC